MTGEELLDRLCDVVVRSEILKDSVVVLDEFTGFTPVQHRLIGRLLKVCSRVSVAVTMDENENPYSYRTPYQLFALGKQTTVKLTQIAKEQRVEIEDPVCLYHNPKNRFSENPALGFLKKNCFVIIMQNLGKSRMQFPSGVPIIRGKNVHLRQQR